MKIDPETFDEWLAHPITDALMGACGVGIEQATDAWMRTSIDGGNCDPLMLAQVRARIAALREIRQMTVETLEEIING